MGHRLPEDVFIDSADMGVESAREVVDELFCAGKTGRFADLVAVICEYRVAKCDVLLYREGKIFIVLEEDGHGVAEVSQFECFYVAIVDENGSFYWIVDAGDKFQDCALSRTVGPNNDLQSYLENVTNLRLLTQS